MIVIIIIVIINYTKIILPAVVASFTIAIFIAKIKSVRRLIILAMKMAIVKEATTAGRTTLL